MTDIVCMRHTWETQKTSGAALVAPMWMCPSDNDDIYTVLQRSADGTIALEVVSSVWSTHAIRHNVPWS
jgi:hypothetical protein